jgi:hypothetical protein
MMDLFGNSSDSGGGGDGHAAGASFMHSLLDTGGSLLAWCNTSFMEDSDLFVSPSADAGHC